MTGMLLVAVVLLVSIRLSRRYILSVRIAGQVIESSGEVFFGNDRDFPQEMRFDNLKPLIFGDSVRIQSNLKVAYPRATELMWEREYLQAISLKNSKLDQKFLELLCAANCVKAITLSSCEIISPVMNGELICPSVVSLAVRTDDPRLDLRLCQIFPNLKHISLECSKVDVRELQNCGNLQRLEIQASTIEGLESLGKLCSLRVVTVTGYVFESPEKLATLADQMKQLTILKVTVGSISDEALEKLISAHPAIRIDVMR